MQTSRALVVAAALFASGCATAPTRYAATYCLTRAQYDALKNEKPAKIHSQLNGQADHDIKPIGGRLVRVEAWGDGLLVVLGGCVDPKS